MNGMSWIRPVVGLKLLRGSRVAVANTYTRRLTKFECVVLKCKGKNGDGRKNRVSSFGEAVSVVCNPDRIPKTMPHDRVQTYNGNHLIQY